MRTTMGPSCHRYVDKDFNFIEEESINPLGQSADSTLEGRESIRPSLLSPATFTTVCSLHFGACSAGLEEQREACRGSTQVPDAPKAQQAGVIRIS